MVEYCQGFIRYWSTCKHFAELIYAQFRYSVSSSQALVSFKCVNITPIFTSKSRNHKNNYRLYHYTFSLKDFWENYEETTFDISWKYSFKISLWFPKRSQYPTLSWCSKIGKTRKWKVQLTGASKTFDCICHNLLIAKSNAYSLSLSVLKLMHNYL